METRFQFSDFLKVFTFSILIFVFFAGIFQLVPGVRGLLDGVHPTVSFLLQYLIQFVVLFFPLWFFVVDKYAASLADFGFNKIKIWKLVKTVLLCYLFYLALAFSIEEILKYTGLSLPGFQEQKSYLPLFGYDVFGLTSAFLVVSLVAPFLEELFFRGFIYRIFTRTWPLWLGSLLTALLFSLIHFQIETVIPLFILGLILNYSYEKTGSVWTSVAFHSLNNTIAFSLDIYLYFHPEWIDAIMSR